MENKISQIDKVVSLIISEVTPDKIILFGSYARGDYTENSDIDILVLKKGVKNERKISMRLYEALFNEKEINVPIDIITMDYDRFYSMKNTIGFIYKSINEQGKIIYEQL